MKTEPRYRNESPAHHQEKERLSQMLRGAGWVTYCEHNYCDVVAHHPCWKFSVGIEVESTPRNMIRNIERNFSAGCLAALVLCLNPQYLRQMNRKLLRYVPVEKRYRVGLFVSSDACEEAIQSWALGVYWVKRFQPGIEVISRFLEQQSQSQNISTTKK